MSPRPDIKRLVASQTKAFIFFCSFLWFCFVPSPCTAGDDNTGYTDCAPRSCNGISIDYPFSLYSTQDTSCGYLNLACRGDEGNALPFLITPTGVQFHVKGINYATHTIKLAFDPSLTVGSECPHPYVNITLVDITDGGRLPFNLSTNYRSVTVLYGCSATKSPPTYTLTSHLVSGCSAPESDYFTYAFSNQEDAFQAYVWLSGCQPPLIFPILASSSPSDFRDMARYLSNEFDLVWPSDDTYHCDGCMGTGGRCGYNASGSFFCFQQDSCYGNCNGHDSRQWWQTIVGGLAMAVGGFLLAC